MVGQARMVVQAGTVAKVPQVQKATQASVPQQALSAVQVPVTLFAVAEFLRSKLGLVMLLQILARVELPSRHIVVYATRDKNSHLAHRS